jgi:transposase
VEPFWPKKILSRDLFYRGLHARFRGRCSVGVSTPASPSGAWNACLSGSISVRSPQWAPIEPLLPVPNTGGRPEKHPRRDIVDAILYVVRTGCAWRQLPVDFPPWQTVYWYFVRWEQAKATEQILAVLRRRVRAAQGRAEEPSAGIIDSQSVRGADTVDRDSRGYDAGKRVNGRKRFIVTDTLGLLLVVCVMAASVQDRDGAKSTLLSAYLVTPVRFGSPTPGSPEPWSTGRSGSCAPHCTSCARHPARSRSL